MHPVEAIVAAGIDAFNRRALGALMDRFAPDVELLTPFGALYGHADVRSHFTRLFASFPAVRMEVEDLRCEEVNEEAVVTHVRVRVYPLGRGSGFLGLSRGLYVCRDGRWLQLVEHDLVVTVEGPRGDACA